MDTTSWILLDTETSGLKAPIYVVEIAAQRMRGWMPDGAPFCRMLNHGIDVSPEATRVNGYTREILERDGEAPSAVYDAFAKYAASLPLVAYNLSYDLDKVLLPEWSRLGIVPIGEPGFCALRLTQRLLDPVPAGNHKLQTLRQFYRLPQRGAHTALGDVETVVDLLQHVLRPLAIDAGLKTWADVCAFANMTWFPSRIAFGKFKGRNFREASKNPELMAWLEWLTKSSNPRTVEMGRWYLAKLASEPDTRLTGSALLGTVGEDTTEIGALVLYRAPEIETLYRLVAEARSRLADLEAEYTKEHHAVDVIRSQLFLLLRPYYQRRDVLRLTFQYKREYLDRLLISGEEEAAIILEEYEKAQSGTRQEYESAASDAEGCYSLSDAEEKELKDIYRKLARTYHPDRYAGELEKEQIYNTLMQLINGARDAADLRTLREIADDPNGYLQRNGLGSLNFEDEDDLSKLQQLYHSLQASILQTIDLLDELRGSKDYDLYRMSRERQNSIQEIAVELIKDLEIEIADLEMKVAELSAEIENLFS